VLVALGATTAVAWAYLVAMAVEMHGMDMGSSMAMEIRPWTALDFVLMFVLWGVMLVGLMGPPAAPTTLVYAAVARKAASQGTPVAPTAAFVCGYVAMWTLFSVAATVAQWALDQAALLSPAMVAISPWLGALLLFAAGLYQLTPAKQACLRHCRAPAHFIAAHWRPGAGGAFRMGAHHGAYCLGCCWALMGLLFFGGVMNLLWIAAITLFVLAEKVLPVRDGAARWTGGAMRVGGALVAAGWIAPCPPFQPSGARSASSRHSMVSRARAWPSRCWLRSRSQASKEVAASAASRSSGALFSSGSQLSSASRSSRTKTVS
jgi:predicted metal-binding membrane protein